MFRGISAINLDNKGRMAIPARYRALLKKTAKSQLVLTIDTKQFCLMLYPLPEWEIIEKKLTALPSFDVMARRVQRLLIGHATEVEMDNSGRILLPTLLRDYAKLQDRVVLIGQGKKFEIWQDDEWTDKRNKWLQEHTSEGEILSAELKLLSL